jgi:hypothetical protein
MPMTLECEFGETAIRTRAAVKGLENSNLMCYAGMKRTLSGFA